MKKMKITALIMSICIICCSFIICSFAEDNTEDVFYYGDVEIIVENDNLTQNEKQIIADYIFYGDEYSGISPQGLACLFGHSLETTYATETTHNKYSTSPKCLVNRYQVETCTRSSCDYINKTLINSYRTSTCHG